MEDRSRPSKSNNPPRKQFSLSSCIQKVYMNPMKQLVSEAVATAIAPHIQEVTVPPCLQAAHSRVCYLSTYLPI